MGKELYVFKAEYCVCCGKMIPEGRQLCFDCEAQLFENDVSQKEIASAPGTESSKINFLSTLPRVFKRKNKKS